jgi:CheY-like chemotaxis protein
MYYKNERGYSILIIDDEEYEHQVLTSFFAELGFEIYHAYNGVEGYENIVLYQPDIILLDILMPKMDGLTLLTKIKSDPHPLSIPIIVISKLDKADYKAVTFRMGVSDYFTKPYSLVELYRRIRIILQNSERYKHVSLIKSGLVEQIGIITLIHTLMFSNQNALLKFPEYKGCLAFINGKIDAAWIGNFRDEEALDRIIFMKKGKFEIDFLNSSRIYFYENPDRPYSLLFDMDSLEKITSMLRKKTISVISHIQIDPDVDDFPELDCLTEEGNLTVFHLLIKLPMKLNHTVKFIIDALEKSRIKPIN